MVSNWPFGDLTKMNGKQIASTFKGARSSVGIRRSRISSSFPLGNESVHRNEGNSKIWLSTATKSPRRKSSAQPERRVRYLLDLVVGISYRTSIPYRVARPPLRHERVESLGRKPLPLERLTTSPEVERAVLHEPHAPSAMGRGALESSSAAFQATAERVAHGARVSATRPNQLNLFLPRPFAWYMSVCRARLPPASAATPATKKPGVLVTSGVGSQKRTNGQASQAQRSRGGIILQCSRPPCERRFQRSCAIAPGYLLLEQFWP